MKFSIPTELGDLEMARSQGIPGKRAVLWTGAWFLRYDRSTVKPLRPSPLVLQKRRRVFGYGAAFAVVAAFGMVVPGQADADIYSFVDKDGVVHFATAPSDPNFKLFLKSTSKARKSSSYTGPIAPPSDRSPERFTRYDTWIRQAATLYQIPEELIRAVIKVESDYDPRAISRAGAQGLMQLMPETALRMQVRDPFDPREAIFGGTRLLRVLANLFNGDLDLTVAAYNAGEGAVTRKGGIPDIPETQDYVVRVRTYYAAYRSSNIASASVIDVAPRTDL